ncbi:MAG TPA: polymer-forming cytoskeletal protein [Candidatus Acidoferrales bacterium]|nr:polymer-forming cytoskeletal protein [Candidatus Acidoferrales bacterium]
MKTHSTNSARADLKIIGDNSASGGLYRNAKIIGDSIINGNLDCINFKSIGNSRIEGNLRSKHVRIVGSVSITGSLETEEVRIDGNVETNGDVNAGDLVLRGGVDIKGGVKSDDLRMTGYATIRKNCEAETFRSEGPLTIGGLLSADDIDIRIHSRCKVAEIGGERVSIRRGHHSKLANMLKSLFMPPDFFKGKLIADSIEGDELQLEDTKAKIVRGKNVMIGDGCEIDLLEYEDACRINGRSTVKEKKRIRS